MAAAGGWVSFLQGCGSWDTAYGPGDALHLYIYVYTCSTKWAQLSPSPLLVHEAERQIHKDYRKFEE